MTPDDLRRSLVTSDDHCLRLSLLDQAVTGDLVCPPL